MTLKDIQFQGKIKANIKGAEREIELIALVLEDDDGVTLKSCFVGCKPEFLESVQKALQKRLIPLKLNAPVDVVKQPQGEEEKKEEGTDEEVSKSL